MSHPFCYAKVMPINSQPYFMWKEDYEPHKTTPESQFHSFRVLHQPLHELTPTFVANKGYATTHFDMDAVEVIGLVKIDVLAQGGLTIMRDVKESLA